MKLLKINLGLTCFYKRNGILTAIEIFMKYIRATFRLILLFVATFIWFVAGLLVLLLFINKTKHTKKVVKSWANWAVHILNIELIIEGSLPSEQVLVMANHRSYLDIFVLLSVFPASIVGKKELKKWPIIGQATKIARMILVDRTEMKSLFETMLLIGNEIQQGGSVIIFPEGTTFEGPLTKKFKSGGFSVAVENQIAVIPCVVFYTDLKDAWVGNDLFFNHFYRQMGKRKTNVRLWFGSPVFYTDARILKEETQKLVDEKLKQFQILI